MQKRLQTARGLRFRISETGDILASISKSSGEFVLTLEVLELLRQLQMAPQFQPKRLTKDLRTSLQQTVENLPPAAELEELLGDLTGAGVLVEVGEESPSSKQLSDGFGDPWIQWAMIADAPRCEQYRQAISSAVTAKSEVVDVGSGLGFLTACALEAGAKHVYMIEETSSSLHSKPILKKIDKRWVDKITLYSGNSEDAKIPTQVNLVISELFGNDPFAEGVLRTLREVASLLDIKKTKFIPDAVEVFCEIADLTKGAIHHRVKALHGAALKSKSSKSSLLDSFQQAALQELVMEKLSFPSALQSDEFRRISAPQSLGKVSLSPPNYPTRLLPGKAHLTLDADAHVPVALVWFRVYLDEKHTLSSHPHEKDAAQHWSPLILPLMKLPAKGDKLLVEASLNSDEDGVSIVLKNGQEVVASREV